MDWWIDEQHDPTPHQYPKVLTYLRRSSTLLFSDVFPPESFGDSTVYQYSVFMRNYSYLINGASYQYNGATRVFSDDYPGNRFVHNFSLLMEQ